MSQDLLVNPVLWWSGKSSGSLSYLNHSFIYFRLVPLMCNIIKKVTYRRNPAVTPVITCLTIGDSDLRWYTYKTMRSEAGWSLYLKVKRQLLGILDTSLNWHRFNPGLLDGRQNVFNPLKTVQTPPSKQLNVLIITLMIGSIWSISTGVIIGPLPLAKHAYC